MLLALVLLIADFGIDRAVATPTSVPASAPIIVVVPGEVVRLADGIRLEKERSKRIELLRGLIADLKRRVADLPDDVSEADAPKVEMIYELNILFGSLKPETMNPATCPNVLRTIRQMTNPSGAANPEISPPGRLALDVVTSVCAP